MDSYFDNTAWHAHRLGRFTASEIYKLLKPGKNKGQIFGDTAMTYIRDVIAEILTGVSSDADYGTIKAMEWGASQEAEAIAVLESQTGWEIEYFGVGNPHFFPFNAFSGGSPDGLTANRVIEIKCPYNSANHVKMMMGARSADPLAWFKKNCEAYYAQVQFNMMCTNREAATLESYDPRMLDERSRAVMFHFQADTDMEDDIRFRLKEAAAIISAFISPCPSALIAHRDQDAGAVIISQA